MNRATKRMYRIAGDLQNTNIETLEEILQIPGMKVRLKNSEELFIKGDNVDLHIYESTIGSVDGKDYLIGGTIENQLQLVEIFIKEIASLLERNNVIYNFEFYRDCSPDEVSQEVIVRHPNF
jgi:uncharacterized protein YlzI (FlbEa/FlbD family)